MYLECTYVDWLIFKLCIHESEILFMAKKLEFSLELMFQCSLFSSGASTGTHSLKV